jgi:uncharacterized Tic20 family protein
VKPPLPIPIKEVGGSGMNPSVCIGESLKNCCGGSVRVTLDPEVRVEVSPNVEDVEADETERITVTPAGRVRHEGVDSADRNLAMVIHLSPLIGSVILGPLAFLAPLVLWLIGKDRGIYIDEHGREAVNFTLSCLIYHVLLAITIIGIALFPILWIFMLINQIRGAIAAAGGEYFCYPMSMRLIS